MCCWWPEALQRSAAQQSPPQARLPELCLRPLLWTLPAAEKLQPGFLLLRRQVARLLFPECLTPHLAGQRQASGKRQWHESKGSPWLPVRHVQRQASSDSSYPRRGDEAGLQKGGDAVRASYCDFLPAYQYRQAHNISTCGDQPQSYLRHPHTLSCEHG